jgi:nicotinate phosphoribosyltransferase
MEYLADLRFTGDVHAMPEGTPFFANEPIIRVTAQLPQAQLVETRLINLLHFQTLIATKAARCVLAAPGRQLIDFGFRRAHGAEAGLLAARASYLTGFAGTATVQAEKAFGIPAYGTMAHSFVQAHDSESLAFENFARSHPANAVLLIDTYDTVAAARKVIELARRLAADGITIAAVRLDSGDIIPLSKAVRRILDEGGCSGVRIFCSGGLDEHRLAEMMAAGAPVDGFGIGTHLDVSEDAPYLDCAYKIQEYAGIARRKRSADKATWPGRKQVFRRFDDRKLMLGDTVTVEGEARTGVPLLEWVMRAGQRIEGSPPLDAIRDYTRAQLRSIPPGVAALDPSEAYVPQISRAIHDLAARVDARFD